MAYLYLHTRRNLPDTHAGLTSWRRAASSCFPSRSRHTGGAGPTWPKVGSSRRDGDERIDFGDVGPRRGQRGERTGIVLIEHPVTHPRSAGPHEPNVRPVSG